MFWLWFISLIVFCVTVIFPIVSWISKNQLLELKNTTKFILAFVAFLSFLVNQTAIAFLSNPYYSRNDEFVTITEVSEVYKSNSTDATSYYYISTESNDEVCEIKVDKLSTGDSNYVITKKYPNDETLIELVVKDKESIKTLPYFNK